MAKALTKMAKIAIFTKFQDFAYDKEPMAEKYAKNMPYVTNKQTKNIHANHLQKMPNFKNLAQNYASWQHWLTIQVCPRVAHLLFP